MNSRVKTALKWVLEAFLSFIAFSFFGEGTKLIVNPLNPSIGGIIGVLSIAGAVAFLVYLLMTLKTKNISMNRNFIHLTIHQPLKKGKTEKNTNEKFVTNNLTNEAYWVSDLIEQYIRRHQISVHYHKNADALIQYFKDLDIKVSRKEPLPEQLLLRYNFNKSLELISVKTVSEETYIRNLLNKLNNQKIDDLKMVYLDPWYYAFSSTKERELPTKALLLQDSTRQAFEPDIFVIDLVAEKTIGFQRLTLRPFESLKKLAIRYGDYHYDRKVFTEKQLLDAIEKAKTS
jgi:hypothetical protein